MKPRMASPRPAIIGTFDFARARPSALRPRKEFVEDNEKRGKRG